MPKVTSYHSRKAAWLAAHVTAPTADQQTLAPVVRPPTPAPEAIETNAAETDADLVATLREDDFDCFDTALQAREALTRFGYVHAQRL